MPETRPTDEEKKFVYLWRFRSPNGIVLAWCKLLLGCITSCR